MGPPDILHSAGLGWRAAVIVSSDEAGPMVVSGVAGGWPALAMKFTMRTRDGELEYSSAFAPPRRWLPSSAWFDGQRERIPLGPMPAGFAMNTIFYAAILALPLSFFPLRGRLRARRGRCLKCGYDLAGVAAGACPECGAQRLDAPHAESLERG